MRLSSQQLSELANLACEAAEGAGALIAGYDVGDFTVQQKAGGDSLASQVVTEVDEKSQAFILDRLESSFRRYDLALLAEEEADDGSRLEKDYFWCIDPLDGTLPFTRGLPGYAVAIALVSRAGEAVIGVVYDPVEKCLYRSVQGQGMTINGDRFRVDPIANRGDQPLNIYCDCGLADFPEKEARFQEWDRLARALGYSGAHCIISGGAVMNACAVLQNPPAVYFKKPKAQAGGGSIWDFAATACLFREAGAVATDFAGEPLLLNSPDSTFMNHCGVWFGTDAKSPS
ncbi:3'(2'),5'-bisphosphate nucleotidase CysQ family protein [Puniceicoccus vermicola]|uniref:Inositol monophosphatase n=1 Tax=Puniceicoccus vermicola TaxID=388746 RepID=A0A7X1AZ97_9BACT|nr:inositol monophosphatase family protein [Puniceicoccus vermicola]MBC2602684.1 inositol monophosphatase [Puniceicoccus vermicola]